MITNYETPEFTQWWNTHCDPDETGRTRMMAAHAFEWGRAFERQKALAKPSVPNPPRFLDCVGPKPSDGKGKASTETRY